MFWVQEEQSEIVVVWAERLPLPNSRANYVNQCHSFLPFVQIFTLQQQAPPVGLLVTDGYKLGPVAPQSLVRSIQPGYMTALKVRS